MTKFTPALRGIVFATAMSAAVTVFAQAADHGRAACCISRPPIDGKAAAATMLLPQATPALRSRCPSRQPPSARRSRRASAAGAPTRKATELKGRSRVAFPRSVPAGSRVDRARRACNGRRSPMAAAPRGSKSCRRAPQRCASRCRCRRARSRRRRCASPAMARTRRCSGRSPRPTLRPTRRASACSGRRCSTATPRRSRSTSTSGVRDPRCDRSTLPRISHQVVAPASLAKLDAKAVQDIGTSRQLQHRRRLRDAAERRRSSTARRRSPQPSSRRKTASRISAPGRC